MAAWVYVAWGWVLGTVAFVVGQASFLFAMFAFSIAIVLYGNTSANQNLFTWLRRYEPDVRFIFVLSTFVTALLVLSKVFALHDWRIQVLIVVLTLGFAFVYKRFRKNASLA